MIAYFGTSALIPLLVEEPGSELAGRVWDAAENVTSVRLIYTQARVALAQAARLGRVAADDLAVAIEELASLYVQLDVLEIDDLLVRRAGVLAQRHALRGYDAVHLGSAERAENGTRRLVTSSQRDPQGAKVSVAAGPTHSPSPRRLSRMSEPDCVGALIRDERHRVFAQRRSPSRRLLPGVWDIVGGHVEPGETAQEALAREVEEETGWRVRHVEAALADWTWEADGRVRHEIDYLVAVDGDLTAPRLEADKHDASAWVGLDDLDLMMEGRTDGDRRLRDIVAKAARTRLTERLRLEPIGHEHRDDLVALHADPGVAAWYEGPWSVDDVDERIRHAVAGWEQIGVDEWIAFDRVSGDRVGRGGVTSRVIDGQERFEVGWALRSDRWGEGLATEIGRAAVRFAFAHLDVDEVVSYTEPDNARSLAVMTRLGMHDPREILAQDRPMVLYHLARERALGEHR